MANVDITAAPADRKKALLESIDAVLAEFDGKTPPPAVRTFLLHVGWHEGAALKARTQIGGGPGRSFYQFEAPRAKDAVAYAKQKGWLGRLATSSGKSEMELADAGDALPAAGAWPANSLIEQLLGAADQDVFATDMIRVALKKIPAAVPAGLDDQAEYWAKHWKIQFASDADRVAKKAQFKAAAQAVDAL